MCRWVRVDKGSFMAAGRGVMNTISHIRNYIDNLLWFFQINWQCSIVRCCAVMMMAMASVECVTGSLSCAGLCWCWPLAAMLMLGPAPRHQYALLFNQILIKYSGWVKQRSIKYKGLKDMYMKKNFWEMSADKQWGFIYFHMQTKNYLVLCSDWLSNISVCDFIWQKAI